jgi:hypothetical protein
MAYKMEKIADVADKMPTNVLEIRNHSSCRPSIKQASVLDHLMAKSETQMFFTP